MDMAKKTAMWVVIGGSVVACGLGIYFTSRNKCPEGQFRDCYGHCVADGSPYCAEITGCADCEPIAMARYDPHNAIGNRYQFTREVPIALVPGMTYNRVGLVPGMNYDRPYSEPDRIGMARYEPKLGF
jgi:hypothetical protein